MKIPAEYNVYYDGEIAKLWRQEAAKIGIETGIYVSVEYELVDPNSGVDERINHIYFKVLGHEFENLTDLRRAIANKSFL